MTNPTCKDCPDRHPICHDSCPRYAEYKRQLKAQRIYTNGNHAAERISRNDIDRITPLTSSIPGNLEERILGSCLTPQQVEAYAGWKGRKLIDCRDAYCWHISNFKLYKKPVKFKDFWAIQPCTHRGDCCTCRRWDAEKLICRGEAFGIERAPQSWCYVEDGR